MLAAFVLVIGLLALSLVCGLIVSVMERLTRTRCEDWYGENRSRPVR